MLGLAAVILGRQLLVQEAHDPVGDLVFQVRLVDVQREGQDPAIVFHLLDVGDLVVYGPLGLDQYLVLRDLKAPDPDPVLLAEKLGEGPSEPQDRIVGPNVTVALYDDG